MSATIQQNLDRLENTLCEVKAHCMFVKLVEDASHITVLIPPGFRVDGIRASKSVGKAKALQMILERMEREWKADQF